MNRQNNNNIFFTERRFSGENQLSQIDFKVNFPSEGDLPIEIKTQEGMVKIANRFGNTSALLIDFLLKEQKRLGETIIIPMGRSWVGDDPKKPNFSSEKVYKSSPELILDSAEKIWLYLNKETYHTIAVDLRSTEWCVVDVDNTNKSIESNLLTYAKELKCFFLIEKSMNGYHLWAKKPLSEKLEKTRLAKQYCMAGFRYDYLAIKYCIVSLGKGRRVLDFHSDRMKNLPALFWPISHYKEDHYELEQGVLRQGERYSTFERRLRAAFEQKINISLPDLYLVNQVNCLDPKDERAIKHIYEKGKREDFYSNRVMTANSVLEGIGQDLLDSERIEDKQEIANFFAKWGWNVDLSSDPIPRKTAGFNRFYKKQIAENLKFYNNCWYGYDDFKNRWFLIEEYDFKDFLLHYLQYYDSSIVSKRLRDDYLSFFKERLRITSKENLKVLKQIQFKDRVVNLETGVYNIPSKNNFCPQYRDFKLEMGLKPLKIFKLWAETFEAYEEAKEVLRLILYMILVRKIQYHDIYLELIGRSGTGKTILVRLITAMLGKEYVASTNFTSLEKRDFGLQNLVGKSIITINECPAIVNEMPTNFKQITSGDDIEINRKNKDIISVSLSSFFILTGNSPIEFSVIKDDASQKESMERRRLRISFKGKPKNINTNLLRVMDGIFMGELLNEIPKLWSWVLSTDRKEAEKKLKPGSRQKFFPSLVTSRKEDISNTCKEKVSEGKRLLRTETEFMLSNLIEDFLKKNIQKSSKADSFVLLGTGINSKKNDNTLMGKLLTEKEKDFLLLGFNEKKPNNYPPITIKKMKKKIEIYMYEIFSSETKNPNKKGIRYMGVKFKTM